VGEKIRLAVHQAIENRSLKNEIDYLRRQQDVEYDHDRIIAASPAMQEIMGTIKRLAQSDANILMTGETGTGKSFISGNIHFNSPRKTKPFVKINCATATKRAPLPERTKPGSDASSRPTGAPFF
jgi:DNA-binding NtrC family response regulator